MAQILKVLHLAHQHGVAEMNVRRRRIETGLHTKWFAGLLCSFEFLDELFLADDLDRAFADVLELFGDRDGFEVTHEFIASSCVPFCR